MQVVKRDGSLQEFDSVKIVDDIIQVNGRISIKKNDTK